MSFDETVKKALRDTEYLSNSFDAWGNKRFWNENGYGSTRERNDLEYINYLNSLSGLLEWR